MSNSIKIKGRAPQHAERAGPESAHAVALALTWEIMEAERLDSDEPPERAISDYRGYLLDLYSECLTTVAGQRVS